MIVEICADGKTLMFLGQNKIFCKMLRDLGNLKQFKVIDIVIHNNREKPKIFNIKKHAGNTYFLRHRDTVLGSWTDLQANLDSICAVINQNL